MNSDCIELLDLRDINNKHGNTSDTQGGYCAVNSEITAEKATASATSCGRVMSISEDMQNCHSRQTQDMQGSHYVHVNVLSKASISTAFLL